MQESRVSSDCRWCSQHRARVHTAPAIRLTWICMSDEDERPLRLSWYHDEHWDGEVHPTRDDVTSPSPCTTTRGKWIMTDRWRIKELRHSACKPYGRRTSHGHAAAAASCKDCEQVERSSRPPCSRNSLNDRPTLSFQQVSKASDFRTKRCVMFRLGWVRRPSPWW